MKKTLIAASVGALMLAAAGTASANSLLFPYFTTTSGAQSVLSLVNTAPNTGLFGPTDFIPVRYVYNYGPECTHFDAVGKLTPNDVLSHSVASPAAGGFGLAVGSDKSGGVYFPEANKNGFLVVSTTAEEPGSLRGSMAIVDPSTGLVVSYAGIEGAAGNNEGDFRNIVGSQFSLTALPSSLVTTSWYSVVTGNMTTAIGAGANWDAVADIDNNGFVYNNDEVAYSGRKTKRLRCAGTVTPADLATSAQTAAVGPNGGLINATAAFPAPTATTGVYQGTGLVMMKMQTVQPAAGGVFVGKQFLHREDSYNAASTRIANAAPANIK